MEEIKLLLPTALRDKLEVKASQQDQSLNQYLVTQMGKLLAAPSVIFEPTSVSDEEVAKLKAKLIKSDDNEISFEYKSYMVYVFSSFPTIIVSEKGKGEAFHFPSVVIDEIAKTFEEAVENAKEFIDSQISETTVSSVSSD